MPDNHSERENQRKREGEHRVERVEKGEIDL